VTQAARRADAARNQVNDTYYEFHSRFLRHPRIGTATPAGRGLFVKPFIAIIGDLFLPQCKKYRVLQKLEVLRKAGIPSDYSHFLDVPRSLQLIQVATLVIFYRTEDTSEFAALIAEARRLHVPTAYDIDDPMFDASIYAANSNTQLLDPSLREHLLSRCAHHSRAMAMCDMGIASTPALASVMEPYISGPVVVWRNGIDSATRHAAELARETQGIGEAGIVIAYASGSLAHEADFMTAARPIAALLERYSDLRLLVLGYASIPKILAPLADRIVMHPFRGNLEYMRSLAMADISIVPLVENQFNACKSAIRFLEAALLGIPTVATAIGDFVPVMAAGGGYLVSSQGEWFHALQQLIECADLRRRVGSQARSQVLRDHTTASVAERLPAAVRNSHPSLVSSGPRLIILNVYFAPSSYGGATVQTENMARIMSEQFGWQVLVVTTFDDPGVVPYNCIRYTIDGLDVVAICVRQHELAYGEHYENPAFQEVFRTILERFSPAAAHVHCIQTMGIGIIRELKRSGVPVAITLHDAWWLCERQFMLDDKDHYCFQTHIDLDVCRYCVVDIARTRQRQASLREALECADLAIFPSQFHLDLHQANTIGADGVVQKNGVKPPAVDFERQPRDEGITLRFGYVGGPGSNKGAAQMLAAFRRIHRTDYELVVVDAAENIGGSWFEGFDWTVPGRLRVHPAYNQQTMDDFFGSIDVLLFPSQWKESFGLTVREALIRDIWVIVSDAGSVAEDCVDGVNGTIIPMTPDPKPLQDAVEQLLCEHRPESFRNPFRRSIVTIDEQGKALNKALRNLLACGQ
jgi:glycosyltransferase involved in cell wall biosynthesis